MQVSTLGIMPPEMVPPAISARASLAVSCLMSLPDLSSTPGTSVSSSSRLALSAPAMAPAKVSALTLYVVPSLEVASGASTGIRSRPRICVSTAVSTLSGSPTNPRSISLPDCGSTALPLALRASTMLPSLPHKPTALPPASLMKPTICLLIEPASTISTISIVAASVMRRPPANRDSMPNLLSMPPICGPPPCTTTGLMAVCSISTMSRAKLFAISSSPMAWPPYFTTTISSSYCCMCGSASERTRAISWGEMVIEEFPGSGGGAAGSNIAAPFSEPPARAKEGRRFSRPALLDEPCDSGAQLRYAGAGARGGHQHLRMRRGMLGERRLGRGDERRKLRILGRIGFGQHDLVVDRGLVQALEYVGVDRLEAVASVEEEVGAREIGASLEKGMDQRGPGLDLRLRGGRITVARQVDQRELRRPGEKDQLLRAARRMRDARERAPSGQRVDQARLADIGAPGNGDLDAAHAR